MNLIAIAFVITGSLCCAMMAVTGWECWKDTENAFFLIGSVLFGIAAVALTRML